MSRRYQIDCEESQLKVLKDALDFYERVLGLGQLEEISYLWRIFYQEPPEDLSHKSRTVEHALLAAKNAGWGMAPDVSMSIRSETVPRSFRIAYDMTQVIRKSMSDAKIEELEREEGSESTLKHLRMTVDRDRFWATSDLRPIKVTYSYSEGEE